MPSRSEIQLFPSPKTGPKMTTLERANFAIRIYPQIVATRFSPKMAIYGTTPFPKSPIANIKTTFNFPKIGRKKAVSARIYIVS